MSEDERRALEDLLGESARRGCVEMFDTRDADLWQWLEALKVAGFELKKGKGL